MLRRYKDEQRRKDRIREREKEREREIAHRMEKERERQREREREREREYERERQKREWEERERERELAQRPELPREAEPPQLEAEGRIQQYEKAIEKEAGRIRKGNIIRIFLYSKMHQLIRTVTYRKERQVEGLARGSTAEVVCSLGMASRERKRSCPWRKWWKESSILWYVRRNAMALLTRAFLLTKDRPYNAPYEGQRDIEAGSPPTPNPPFPHISMFFNSVFFLLDSLYSTFIDNKNQIQILSLNYLLINQCSRRLSRSHSR